MPEDSVSRKQLGERAKRPHPEKGTNLPALDLAYERASAHRARPVNTPRALIPCRAALGSSPCPCPPGAAPRGPSPIPSARHRSRFPAASDPSPPPCNFGWAPLPGRCRPPLQGDPGPRRPRLGAHLLAAPAPGAPAGGSGAAAHCGHPARPPHGSGSGSGSSGGSRCPQPRGGPWRPPAAARPSPAAPAEGGWVGGWVGGRAAPPSDAPPLPASPGAPRGFPATRRAGLQRGFS